MITSRVDHQGRIVIPARWRNQQGVVPGSELVILEEEGRLIIQTREQAVQEAQAIVRRVTRPGVSLVDALLRERRGEVKREKSVAARRGRKHV